MILARSQPLVLGLDTATERSSIALVRGDATIGFVASTDEHRRGEKLAETVRGLFGEAGVDFDAIDGIAVVVGPGSYTGLRVGLALARGLALVDRLPVVGVGSLELIAHAAGPVGRQRAALLAAGRGKVFAACYLVDGDSIAAHVEPSVVEETDLEGLLAEEPYAAAALCVDAATLDAVGRERFPTASGRCIEVAAHRAEVLAAIGARRIAAGGGEDAERVLPLYIGGSGARPNRNRVARFRGAPR